ncbi:WD40-repeat-containing domain protein [Xylogone sp. PMI_703]|nr:WD40-repeat-containing domain protein [Xylogone sp. PMI_703]
MSSKEISVEIQVVINHDRDQCLTDLRLTDPRDDKRRIEEMKGGLLVDSYRWILDNDHFQEWREERSPSPLLWIKGGPGKGKTMLICGIINELDKSDGKSLMAYFFCQATDSRINSATAVLRGLLYMLVDQQPSLVPHIQKKYKDAGKALFEDVNAWSALSELLINTLQDLSAKRTVYLIIDALDECVVDLPKLLHFITQKSSMSSHVKWIVSSRNWLDIERRLEIAEHKMTLCLELNAESISTAVNNYIRHKVKKLAQQNQYNKKTQDAILNHFFSNANNTFLWVALVCQHFEDITQWHALAELNTFPPGLDSLYERMIERMSKSRDADFCKKILALVTTVYRPITLKELALFIDKPKILFENLDGVINSCGSLISVRNGIIYLVHQSAKDYLTKKAPDKIFPSGNTAINYTIFSRSLWAMSKTLHRDMYNLQTLSYPIEQVKQPNPDPLETSRYSCIYWVNHLYECDWNSSSRGDINAALQDGGIIEMFIREKYIHWLEALSLCRSMSEGIISMEKLETLIKKTTNAFQLSKLVLDARRFMMYHKQAIESYPLQVYASALLFSPRHSLIKVLFEKEKFQSINIQWGIENEWNPCLQTLEGHSSCVCSVIFSHNSELLASCSDDETIKIWDSKTGSCLRTLEGHRGFVNSVVFSYDSKFLASGSYDQTIRIWDSKTGGCLRTLEGHHGAVLSVILSSISELLVSSSRDRTIKIWNGKTGRCLRTLRGHNDDVNSLAFTHDSKFFASGSDDHTIKIWDIINGDCQQTFTGHNRSVHSVAFSHDSKLLAPASGDKTVKIWDTITGNCLQTFKGHNGHTTSAAFSHDSKFLASTSWDHTVKVWDITTGNCLQTFEGHNSGVCAVVFSHDSRLLASASMDYTIKVWDMNNRILQELEKHPIFVNVINFSHDSTLVASASLDGTIKIWNAKSGRCIQTLKCNEDRTVEAIAFSQNLARLALLYADGATVEIRDVRSGKHLQTFEPHDMLVNGGDTYSYDEYCFVSGRALLDLIGSDQIVGISSDKMWITHNSEKLVLIPPEYRPRCAAVSGGKVAFGTSSGRVWLCDLEIGG